MSHQQPPPPNHVVQFDLANDVSESELQNTYFGRRKVPNDWCKDVKEALIWMGPDELIGKAANKKMSMVQQNRML
jgi:hypothetical protein